MENEPKKYFLTNHAKSSAAAVSIVLHLILLLIAGTFVAVTVVTKGEKKFEAKQVSRPRMPPRKLQVPVKIKKQRPRPRLRQRIVVKHTVNRNMPDIKMPEISGIKGGMGATGGAGLGNAHGIGFSMPEIEIFGIKSKGEKVFLILDSEAEIMADEIGGIPAYTIIKSEMMRVIAGLGPTALFNVAVYEGRTTHLLFPALVPANAFNVAKAEQWLKPLNSVHANMTADEYGVKTLGSGGSENKEDLRIMKFAEGDQQRDWYLPAMLAMKQQADTVFLFTHSWGVQWYHLGENRAVEWMKTSAGKRYKECYEKGKKLLAEENKERLARGEAPRAIRDHPWVINKAYFPSIEFPPASEKYNFTPKDFVEAFLATGKKFNPHGVPLKSGFAKKSGKNGFSFNVVHFIAESDKPSEHLKKLAGSCDGDYRTIRGLKAIESHVKAKIPE